MKILQEYKNGNVDVKIYEDGTLEREYPDDQEPMPEFPSSIDVKITNYCYPTEDNPICSYCHEKSNTKGKHSSIDKLLNTLSVLPAGVEIAIGGGAAQSHPNFKHFLSTIRKQGLIPNLTINEKHLKDSFNDLNSYINKDIFGIGISYSDKRYFEDIKKYIELSDNVVFHLIMGINKLSDIDDLLELCNSYSKKCKVLILGYKQFGWGINYYVKNKSVEDNKYSWYTQLPRYFNKENLILSFDNLAINQLNLKRFFFEESWNQFFMGEDFTHTMYIDAVNEQYAPTSTSDYSTRKSFDDLSLIDYFKTYRNK